jgi:hypothetical protein
MASIIIKKATKLIIGKAARMVFKYTKPPAPPT